MGRPIKYTDEGHKWHREQVKQSRSKYKDAFKPSEKPNTTKFDDSYNKTITSLRPTIKQEIVLTPETTDINPNIAAYIQNKKCLGCKDLTDCHEPCTDYKKLYDYEVIQQKNRLEAKKQPQT